MTNGAPNKKKQLWLAISMLAAAQGVHALEALEEVIVTAQKRAETIQDIPATVNALQGDVIDKYKAFNFKELEQVTQGLSLTVADSRRRTVSIRGVSFDPDSNAASAVDVYWNGQVLAAGDAFQQLFDVERVEVLRGPQGTLQGRTSPAGAIMIYTKRPDMETLEGSVQQSFDDNGGANSELGLSLPIIPGELAVRLAGVYDENDGEGIKNLTTGTDQKTRAHAGRITIDWEPNDDFDASLAYQYLESTFTGSDDLEGRDLLGQGKPTLDTYDRKALAKTDGYARDRVELATLNANWRFAGHELSSITGYRDTTTYSMTDRDPTRASSTVQNQFVDPAQEQFSQELRLASTDTEIWEYMVGLYYDKARQQTDFAIVAGGRPAAMLNIPSRFERFGVFTHHYFHLTDDTTLQAGARWNRQRRNNRSDVLNPVTGAVLLEQIKPENQVDTTEAVTGTLKLSHNLNPDLMIYAAYDTSYRPSGAVVTPTIGLEPDLYVFDEEKSQALELGFKSKLWEGRAQLNGSVFYQKFDNFISRVDDIFADALDPTALPPAGQPGDGIADMRVQGGLTYNGDAIIQGAEMDLDILLTENWTMTGGVSYTDARYDGAQIPCNVPGPNGRFIIPAGAGFPGSVAMCDADGDLIGSEPAWSGNLNTDYLIPLDPVDLYIRGAYKFTGGRANALVQDGDVGGYGTFNVYAGVRDKGEAWDVSVWAKNLFDKQARTGTEPDLFNSRGAFTGYRSVKIIAERTIGVTASYRFSM